MLCNEIELLVSDDIIRVEAYGSCLCVDTAATLFRFLAEDGILVDLISLSDGQNPPRLTFSVSNRDFPGVIKAIAQFKENVDLRISVQSGYSKITLKGNHLPYESGIAAACFRSLKTAGTEPTLVTASGTALSILIQTDALDKTLTCFETVFHTTAQAV